MYSMGDLQYVSPQYVIVNVRKSVLCTYEGHGRDSHTARGAAELLYDLSRPRSEYHYHAHSTRFRTLSYLLYAWAIQKAATRKTGVQNGREDEKLAERPSSSGLCHRLSQLCLRKAAEGVIPAKHTLVCGYSSKGGGQENRFQNERED